MTRAAIGVVLLLALVACSRKEPDSEGGKNTITQQATERTGALVDEVVFSKESDPAKATERIEAGSLHVYTLGIKDPGLYRRIQASKKLAFEKSYGSSSELAFNPVGPTFPATGKLNPFSSKRIRAAMNRLIDRKHISEEIYGGLAVPRTLPISRAFPDYARLVDVAKRLENRYSYDPSAAKATIREEMKKLGATLQSDKWHYEEEPVEIIILIRTEDKRREIGDYVANLLEGAGFTVDRQYKNAQEASRLWIHGGPGEGRWHVYTGGWISTIISRDQATTFSTFYTNRGRPEALWQAYDPSEEFDTLADRLQRRDYETWEERQKMFARALELSLEESFRVWLIDSLSIWPHPKNMTVATDLAGGVSGSRLWPYTLQFTDQEGGRALFGEPSILTGPWNPVAGTNWIYDTMIQRGTGDLPVLPDPFTGLFWPQRIVGAKVIVREGTPVIKTLDWVTLEAAERIEVPADAWIDWDAQEGRWKTVGEVHPDGLEARTATVITYEDDLFERTWHDGSHLSGADFVAELIISFARGKKESPLFDQAYVPTMETFRRHFRGVRVTSRNPWVIESYTDQIYPDAEYIASSATLSMGSGFGPWHTLALGVLAEREKKLAFSSDKADRMKTEWASYIAGPSIPIFSEILIKAKKDAFLPWPKVMEAFISDGEVEARYEALEKWNQEREHFWVGNGPFYLDSVHPTEGNVVLRRYENFKDPSDKWLRFSKPRIPDVAVTGPVRVDVGTTAAFDVSVLFEGKPYPEDEIEFVRYLVFDGRGDLATQGDASRSEHGWTIELTPDQTATLRSGSNRLDVAVASKSVALTAFESHSFATMGE